MSSPLRSAAALALGAAVSLGLARFSYALLLPPMRADLGWSYLVAGTMNTANAAGYLLGALLMPRWMARVGARAALVGGSVAAAGLLALHGLTASDGVLLLLRTLTGAASAATFIAGGVLASRLATRPGSHAGLVLGLYYGGTGLGIVACAALLPPLLARPGLHAWQAGWWLLGALALACTPVMSAGAAAAPAPPPAAAADEAAFEARRFGFGLAGYFMFGVGYIGYMTFIVTLLREQGLAGGMVSAFYALLGVGVVASSWLWAGLLQRHRGGTPLALLNGLLALAAALPLLAPHPVLAFASGALFGAVFLSVVASTTALVRHNLPPAAWTRGISAFTIVFAVGQIAGPTLVGWLSDGGGLRAGLALSAAALALGALLATRQHPLHEGRPAKP